MNSSPRKRWDGWQGDPTYNPGCGKLAMENTNIAGWQSRLNMTEPPQLTDIHNLAALLRVRQPDSSEAQ